jgi:hypothetical protein
VPTARLSRTYLGIKLAKLKRLGVVRFAGYHLVQLLRYAGIHIYAVYHGEIAATAPADIVGSDLSIGVIPHQQLLRFARNPELDLTPRFLEAAARRGDVCIGALEGDRLIAYTWRSDGQTPAEDGFRVSLERPQWYRYKTLTLPAHRGRQLAAALHAVAGAVGRAGHHAETIGYIRINNFASAKAARRSGYRRVGYAGYLSLFGLNLPFRTPGAGRHGFRFVVNGSVDLARESATVS